MSELPAFVLVGLLVAAVLLVVTAVWLARGLRGAGGAKGLAAVVTPVGVAGAFVALVVFGMQHYGGSSDAGADGVLYNCDQWYQEVALPSGTGAEAGDLSPHCRHDAIAAIWPAIGWAALIGAGVAALALLAVLGSRRLRVSRRRPRGGDRPTIRYVDSDS